MDPLLKNDGEDAETERKMHDMEGLPPEEKGLSKKRKVQIFLLFVIRRRLQSRLLSLTPITC